MELSTALIWTLRIVLPIILFCIYFKLQTPKDEQYSGSTENRYTSKQLLAQRKVVLGRPVPREIANIATKDKTEAPSLFVGGRAGKGGRRVGDESRGVNSKGKKGRSGEESQEGNKNADEEGHNMTAKDEYIIQPIVQDKMNMEALVNYVAFSGTRQQRIFLVNGYDAPPPPPPPPKLEDSGSPAASTVADKASFDMHLVLRGAASLRRSPITKHIYDQLTEARTIEKNDVTYELMIEACLLAEDLKGASDFLMQMESAGFLPRPSLLDKVMELYAKQKQKPVSKAEASEKATEAVALKAGLGLPWMDELGARTKLCSTAPVFVPFVVPPPPPPTDSPGLDEINLEESRTKLSASSKAFEPKFNVTFEAFKPVAHSWTAEEPEEQDFDYRKGQNGKGQNGNTWEQGENYGKGKGRDKDWHSRDDYRGKGKGHANGKNWDTGGDYWSFDDRGKGKNWFSDKKWSSDANWSAEKWSKHAKWSADSSWPEETKESKVPTKKIWVEKQPPKASENGHSEKNGKSI